MKVFTIWVSLLLFGTSLLIPNSSGSEDTAFYEQDDSVKAASTQKSKGNAYDSSNVDLEDYHRIDPAPSSKASIRHGPIQHGSPLLPFIVPRPPPPGRPRTGGST